MARAAQAEMIGVNQYPSMLTADAAARFVETLSSTETATRAQRMIELRRDQLCDAVLNYIQQLESAAAASDLMDVFSQAHEIRGLAATAGMEAAGSIAHGLCLYLDASREQKTPVDPTVITLHVDAIVRTSSSIDEARKFGDRVAAELGALVARKLRAVNAEK